MRELLLRIRALFEGRAQTEEAKKAVEEVADKTKEVGEEAAAAKPKVDALLDSTKKASKEAAKDLDDVNKKLDQVAERPSPGDAWMDDFRRQMDDMKTRADALPGGPAALTPPPLPDSGPGAAGAATGGPINTRSLFSAQLAADITLKSIVALIGGVKAFVSETAQGAQRAAEMAQGLERMDEAGRKAAIEALGPLGVMISENAPLLAEFGRDVEQASGKIDEMWTAMGARLIPSLADGADAIANLDVTKLGRDLGDIASGAVETAKEVDNSTRALTGGAFGAGEFAVKFTAAAAALELFKNKGREFNEAQLNDPAVQARIALEAEEAKLTAIADIYDALNEMRKENADASAPLADQLATAQERQAAAIAAQNKKAAVEQEQQIQALIKKIEIETAAETARAEAEKKRNEEEVNRASAAATAEGLRRQAAEEAAASRKQQLELTIALNEAVAAGNKDEAEKVRWMQEYLRLQQQGSSEEDARRAANASSAARLANSTAQGETDAVGVRATADPGVRPGELFPGTNRRRGAITSDSFEQSIDITRASRPQTNFADATRGGSNWAGTQGSDTGGEQKDTGGDAVKKAAEDLAKGQTETNNATAAILQKIVAGHASQKQKLDQLSQKVDAMKSA